MAMGIVELHKSKAELIIHSVFYFYGDAADDALARRLASEISEAWNQPESNTLIRRKSLRVIFRIAGHYLPGLRPEDVWYNDDPRNNYFRIEEFSDKHISFVDGLGSNTGYFKLDNLSQNSTTAAHEYGHTLGLDHPGNLDIRGLGQPGIMYPRGTICDPEFQYDPAALPLQPGGTLNPFTRSVLSSDIEALRLNRLSYDRRGRSVLGSFSSIYHEKHLALL